MMQQHPKGVKCSTDQLAAVISHGPLSATSYVPQWFFTA